MGDKFNKFCVHILFYFLPETRKRHTLPLHSPKIWLIIDDISWICPQNNLNMIMCSSQICICIPDVKLSPSIRSETVAIIYRLPWGQYWTQETDRHIEHMNILVPQSTHCGPGMAYRFRDLAKHSFQ